ncbi:DUF2164 domain-containing protein [Aliivibrio fischeri]|uniref:DUF2164 domain-containing protein n=1 Tax=Aliivibrio fischeri SR5 TaxID=1088719 RepID=A0AAV3EP74_ALIFS|nr:DUF2164 domain-containing protein [Aliivibrio fischeri]EHN68558.1 hypothetical protein VFSR5_A0456 [Aliivibrio fischeri SR5]MUJ25043.1 DUF2164 family protein [Aliivibrio fischeri]MUK27284.1 DUF2164 family protein [Aliivibrio fischeri]MUK35822.1 DUF2164 family protein [Aliivibrio fischeri]MUK37430.1 DUF2164 family protein [Aliivibrio fischeri]
MPTIDIPKNKRDELIQQFQRYFEQELDHELGQFDGEFLLDFIIKQTGPVFYNQGLADAQAIIERKTQDIADEIYEIELPES